MNCKLSSRRNRALTLVEVLVVLAVVFIIFTLVIPNLNSNAHAKARAVKIQCASNLQQVGLAFRIWEGDNGDRLPMNATNAAGGLMFSNVISPLVYFQAMSNELNNPKVLWCPAEANRMRANNWTSDFHASNISYFIGRDADEKLPQSLLSGDDNLTNGTQIVNGMLMVTTNSSISWTAKRHIHSGNVGLADGSVQQWSDAALQRVMANTGLATNRLLMP